MIQQKEERVATSIHLKRKQLLLIDRIARETGQSRAHVLRELVDAGLSMLTAQEESQESQEEKQQVARERLLRMGEGYGKSGRRSLRNLDRQIYEDS